MQCPREQRQVSGGRFNSAVAVAAIVRAAATVVVGLGLPGFLGLPLGSLTRLFGGFNGILFGIIIVMNLVIGALTPPLGVLVFTTARVGGANQTETFKAITPFVLTLILVLLLVTFIPALTMLPIAWLGP